MIGFITGLLSFRRGPWEMMATIITVMFIVVSHFRE